MGTNPSTAASLARRSASSAALYPSHHVAVVGAHGRQRPQLVEQLLDVDVAVVVKLCGVLNLPVVVNPLQHRPHLVDQPSVSVGRVNHDNIVVLLHFRQDLRRDFGNRPPFLDITFVRHGNPNKEHGIHFVRVELGFDLAKPRFTHPFPLPDCTVSLRGDARNEHPGPFPRDPAGQRQRRRWRDSCVPTEQAKVNPNMLQLPTPDPRYCWRDLFVRPQGFGCGYDCRVVLRVGAVRAKRECRAHHAAASAPAIRAVLDDSLQAINGGGRVSAASRPTFRRPSRTQQILVMHLPFDIQRGLQPVIFRDKGPVPLASKDVYQHNEGYG